MKLIGKFLLFIVAVCLLAVAYWYSPAMMHSQSRLLNFLQLIGAAIVVGLALIMLMGVVILNTSSSSPLPNKIPAPPKPRSVPVNLTGEFNYIRQQLHASSEKNAIGEYTMSIDGRMCALHNAVTKLAAITELNSSK